MTRTFSIDMVDEPGPIVAKARHAAEKYGAAFQGDDHDGTFKGNGIAGNYRVEEGKLHITITEKPPIAPWSMIESAVKDFFS